MAIVIGIKFRTGQKVYYFDPNGAEFEENDNAVLETARGLEYGKVVMGNKDVPDTEIVQPLKSVTRKATEKDDAQHERNMRDREGLIRGALDKVAKRQLQMKIVDAEYTFDRSKVIIFFTAESRIDFRELVKDLASMFHVRIELRQIYERDDIKLRGALATCGRPCCCITHLANYDKVSIKMAKLQGLSLSPNKISGCCGMLMCCLKYEYPYYQEVSKMMPKMNSQAKTPEGDGVVVGHDLLKQQVRVKITDKDGSYEFKDFPLAEINKKEGCNCGENCKKKAEIEAESADILPDYDEYNPDPKF
ncbi:MAG: regulatory iron-sulfur-containing complex subunit RicT [Bacillota bacterium]